jgi:hypothetical protein
MCDFSGKLALGKAPFLKVVGLLGPFSAPFGPATRLQAPNDAPVHPAVHWIGCFGALWGYLAAKPPPRGRKEERGGKEEKEMAPLGVAARCKRPRGQTAPPAQGEMLIEGGLPLWDRPCF